MNTAKKFGRDDDPVEIRPCFHISELKFLPGQNSSTLLSVSIIFFKYEIRYTLF